MYLLENKHPIGYIEDTMTVLYITNKCRQMDTIEKFHIYKETKNSNQINDKNTVKPNIIFDIVAREETDRVHTPT